MRIKFELDASISGIMEDEIRLAERAITAGVKDTAEHVQKRWRGQIVAAGLGDRLARAIRKRNFPDKGDSISAASLVYAQPNRKQSASAADVINAFDKGALIRSQHGMFLAIPTPAAGRNPRGARMTPQLWEKRTGLKLRFVPRRTGPSWLVLDKARINVKGAAVADRRRRRKALKTVEKAEVIFFLVPQVSLKKRIDLARDTRDAGDRLVRAVMARWR
ncbi:DUF6441 family protein [Paenirhodobacter populi]|uniref:Uncharacterized protein n=1 Tax=Paenirhodobacter populi TaxID=2306993 RepID=A0A443JDV2_9RHOB|nr:DUF6441 family protein [Sinirhodobacter populi]RWR18523.1 hypothetical protein D2T30_16160 [Sinirhodobacter populi]